MASAPLLVTIESGRCEENLESERGLRACAEQGLQEYKLKLKAAFQESEDARSKCDDDDDSNRADRYADEMRRLDKQREGLDQRKKRFAGEKKKLAAEQAARREAEKQTHAAMCKLRAQQVVDHSSEV